MTLEKRIAIEKRIVRETVKTLLSAGFALSVDNGGDDLEIHLSTDEKAILEVMGETDQDEVCVFDKTGEYQGMVFFVYGNDGYDVINNYSVSLEEILSPVNELADKLELTYC